MFAHQPTELFAFYEWEAEQSRFNDQLEKERRHMPRTEPRQTEVLYVEEPATPDGLRELASAFAMFGGEIRFVSRKIGEPVLEMKLERPCTQSQSEESSQG